MLRPTPPEAIQPRSSNRPGLLSLRETVAGLESEGVWPLSPSSKSVPLVSGWSDFLTRYDWQWFGTFTFREEVHPEKADKLFRLWCALLDESLLGRNWWRPQKKKLRLQWIRGLEWQKRGVLHYHAMFRNLPAYCTGFETRLMWAAEWDKLAGFAKIEAPESQQDCVAYVAKYCSKGGEVDVCPTLSRKDEKSLRISGTVK